MVTIVNCTSPPTKTGENIYKLGINHDELALFTHNRENRLSVLLRKAADAYDQQYMLPHRQKGLKLERSQFSLKGLMNQEIQLQHNFEKASETSKDEEAERWSERLDWLHTEYGADCSGCDSGDPLDLIEVEIRQAIETAVQSERKACYEVAQAAFCHAGLDMATVVYIAVNIMAREEEI